MSLARTLTSIEVGSFTLLDIVVVVGLVSAAYFSLRVVFSILGSLLSSLSKRRLPTYGKYAVVTGATDGIGEAYASELAKRGLDVVIIARNAEKLASVAAKITGETGRTVKTITADFAKPAGLYARIDKELRAATGGDIGILVNNVGISYVSALYFDELEAHQPSAVEDLIEVNIVAATRMAQLVLPGMKERKKGAIVNVSSAAGRLSVGNPLYAVCEFDGRGQRREHWRFAVFRWARACICLGKLAKCG